MKDEIIEEIRAVRHQISEEFGHDVQHYIDYLNRQSDEYAHQLELGRQLLKRSEPKTGAGERIFECKAA